MASQLVRLLDQHDLPAVHVPTGIFVVARLAMGGEVIAVPPWYIPLMVIHTKQTEGVEMT